ncbi:MAG: hypothetical protein COB76_02160 [Alphaproteobacteria bacterium]|nr:MAG: hypothetical protein COB76_02160 [Alphaproteobacteria bacterium]
MITMNNILHSKILKQSMICQLVICCSLLNITAASAATYAFKADKILQVQISKSGLNRISNPPYKIVQVTGDDSTFRLKHDEDGTNIFLMPLAKIDEKIELSIKNNVGDVQDLELHVANIKGRSIIIDGTNTLILEHREQKEISHMLRAMKDNVVDKYYVQNSKQMLANIGELTVNHTKIYKYKNLTGGVFEVKNPTKKEVILDISEFAKRFDNPQTSYPKTSVLSSKQIITVFVIQKLVEK